ncbi:MAG: multiheme c-type cytochrome [Burkholderiaceae bacterium]
MLRMLLATVVLLTALGQSRPVVAGQLSIVYTGPLMGELEPCGCSLESDMGGIRRLASVVDRMRDAKPDLVLLSTGGLFGTAQAAHEVTNRFILEGIAALDYDGIGLLRRDFVHGLDALGAKPLPWVASNWTVSDSHAPQRLDVSKGRLIAAGSNRVAFLNWLAPSAVDKHSDAEGQSLVKEDLAILTRQLKALKTDSVFTIVGLSDAASALNEMPLDLINVLLLTAPDEMVHSPEKSGQTWILRAGTRGQRLGQLSLKLTASGNWTMLSHETVDLDMTVADARRLDPWYQRYESALMEDYRVREQVAQKNQSQGQYVGNKTCGLCHSNQKAQWETTDHARAYHSLTVVSKQFDANCVGCHVVGFGEPGGFSSADGKPDLRNVACEACHGPATAHQLSGGTKPLTPVTIQVCTACHTDKQSPTFDAQKYWSRVVH